MNTDPEYLAQRAIRIGIVVNLVLPALLVAVAVVLREGRLITTPPDLPEPLRPLFYILGVVALMELAVAYFLRRMFFSAGRVAPFCHDGHQVELWVVRSSTIIFALGASPIVYGVVIYLLGAALQQLAFFGIVTLLAYRLLHPTADLIDETLEAARNIRGAA